jgi:hypothetical protein
MPFPLRGKKTVPRLFHARARPLQQIAFISPPHCYKRPVYFGGGEKIIQVSETSMWVRWDRTLHLSGGTSGIHNKKMEQME